MSAITQYMFSQLPRNPLAMSQAIYVREWRGFYLGGWGGEGEVGWWWTSFYQARHKGTVKCADGDIAKQAGYIIRKGRGEEGAVGWWWTVSTKPDTRGLLNVQMGILLSKLVT